MNKRRWEWKEIGVSFPYYQRIQTLKPHTQIILHTYRCRSRPFHHCSPYSWKQSYFLFLLTHFCIYRSNSTLLLFISENPFVSFLFLCFSLIGKTSYFPIREKTNKIQSKSFFMVSNARRWRKNEFKQWELLKWEFLDGWRVTQPCARKMNNCTSKESFYSN